MLRLCTPKTRRRSGVLFLLGAASGFSAPLIGWLPALVWVAFFVLLGLFVRRSEACPMVDVRGRRIRLPGGRDIPFDAIASQVVQQEANEEDGYTLSIVTRGRNDTLSGVLERALGEGRNGHGVSREVALELADALETTPDEAGVDLVEGVSLERVNAMARALGREFEVPTLRIDRTGSASVEPPPPPRAP